MAPRDFLFYPDGICMQGIGKLKDGRYISCTDSLSKSPELIGFEWKGNSSDYTPFNTAACNPNNSLIRGKTLYIPQLRTALGRKYHPNNNGFVTVSDVGHGLESNSIDIYVGEGQTVYEDYVLPIMALDAVEVYWKQ